VGDCDRAQSMAMLVMRASAGDAANNAAASDATRVTLKVKILRRTAKKWLIDDSPW